MTLKSHQQFQNTSTIENQLISKAKNLIHEHPGIYKGDIICRLQREVKIATIEDIQLCLIKLGRKGYFFDYRVIYPPEHEKSIYKRLKWYILKNHLKDEDFEILMAIHELKYNAKPGNIARYVVSLNTKYNELQVLYESSILAIKGLIIPKPSNVNQKYLDLNWEKIDGDVVL